MATHPLPAHVHQLIVEWIDTGKAFAMITVLNASASTPRKAGTRMLVDAAGDARGTIGGGLLEHEARRAAGEALRTGRPSVFDFPFIGSSARGDDPVCGGRMRILVDPAPAAHARAYAAASDAAQCRRRGALVTTVRGATEVDVRWHECGSGAAPVGPVASALRTGVVTYAETATAEPGRRVELLTEPVLPAPLLLVAGGGHVAQALARQASLLDFQVAVFDDRPEFADPDLYPATVGVRCGRFAEGAKEFVLNADTYVAVVGRGHKVDADALAAVIHQPVAYVGMMGSRRKVALIRREFIESGLATEEQFSRVHAPIGLDIGAETVEEIAASIVAELIAVRRGKRIRREA
jgi:xanthine dehydrogenase accessory factor